MKSLWFNDVKNIDELKKRYKELCKQHHPDLGGSNENMQMINYAYKRCLNELKMGSGHTSERIRDEEEIEADLMKKIQEIVTIPGIEIEVCSLWIWVSGNTYAVKERVSIDRILNEGTRIAYSMPNFGIEFHSRGTKD